MVRGKFSSEINIHIKWKIESQLPQAQMPVFRISSHEENQRFYFPVLRVWKFLKGQISLPKQLYSSILPALCHCDLKCKCLIFFPRDTLQSCLFSFTDSLCLWARLMYTCCVFSFYLGLLPYLVATCSDLPFSGSPLMEPCCSFRSPFQPRIPTSTPTRTTSSPCTAAALSHDLAARRLGPQMVSFRQPIPLLHVMGTW